jgi:hypothetical protein
MSAFYTAFKFKGVNAPHIMRESVNNIKCLNENIT